MGFGFCDLGSVAANPPCSWYNKYHPADSVSFNVPDSVLIYENGHFQNPPFRDSQFIPLHLKLCKNWELFGALYLGEYCEANRRTVAKLYLTQLALFRK